ncbi:gp24 [Enterobacter cloacae]|nr:gp24 [Enterobacter cloacae]
MIATETEARVTDVTRLEVKTEQNEAGITEVRQALSDETQARATAVDQLTASTQVISDKADSASSKADAASGKADAAEQASSQNTADITTLRQVVTDTTSSMASRLEELIKLIRLRVKLTLHQVRQMQLNKPAHKTLLILPRCDRLSPTRLHQWHPAWRSWEQEPILPAAASRITLSH